MPSTGVDALAFSLKQPTARWAEVADRDACSQDDRAASTMQGSRRYGIVGPIAAGAACRAWCWRAEVFWHLFS